MIAVIFEVWVNEGRREDYLALAGELREALVKSDGFISIERFESLYDQGKLLSLQFWRDEESVRAWRERLDHRRAQTLGREDMFRDYRLRVATVTRDYGMTQREGAPADSRAAHG